jgi:hypothetical protein
MDHVELVKRLYRLSQEEILTFVSQDRSLQESMFKVHLAARTRHIIHAVQVEDFWQELENDSEIFNLCLSFKLSPMTLSSCLDLKKDLNDLEWWIVLPKHEDIPADQMPKSFAEYLSLIKSITVPNLDTYDVEEACNFLDETYDFSYYEKKNGGLDA